MVFKNPSACGHTPECINLGKFDGGVRVYYSISQYDHQAVE